MTTAEFIAALELPPACLLRQRVAKKAILEHANLSFAEKRLLGAVEEIVWEASVRPSNVAIPAVKEGEELFEEIQVFSFRMKDEPFDVAQDRRGKMKDALGDERSGMKDEGGKMKDAFRDESGEMRVESGSQGAKQAVRIAALLHKLIPYPLVIVSGNFVSVAWKRRSLVQAERVVVEEHVWAHVPAAVEGAFLGSLALAGLSHLHLRAVYEGWQTRVVAAQVAERTGVWTLAGSAEDLAAQRAELARLEAVAARVRALKAEAKRTKSLQRLAEINLELRGLG